MDIVTEGCIFIGANVLGFFLAYLYARKTKRFRWSEYFALILLPVVTVIILAYLNGPKIIELFILSSCVGFVLEYLLGLSYHKVLHAKLWEYHKYSVDGYTSLLSLPFWGVAGVVFWFLGKMIGI